MSRFSVRILVPALSLLTLIALTGCEDPSNVGVGIIGVQDSDPIRVSLSGADLPSEREPLITGGIRSGSSFSGPGRFLVGNADDPVFGLIAATAYVDFSIPITASDEFRSGTVQSVTVVLARDDYVYGDTVTSSFITLADMPEAWPAFTIRSDTTLTPGDTVASQTFAASSETLTFEMSDEWISMHASELLDPNFVEVFDGFQVRGTGPAAVSGFVGLDSFMRVTTSTGSLNYPMSKLLTTLKKEPGADIAGRTAVQDGFGDNAVLDFDFEVDSIAGSAVSRAVVDVRIDLSVFDSAPENFVRPVPAIAQIIGIRSNGTRRVLESASIGSEGRVSFVSSTANAGEFNLVRSVQLAVSGNSEFEKYAVTVTESQAAIAAVLLYNASAEEDQPEAVITLVPNPFAP